MRAEPNEENPNVNIMLRSRIKIGDDKGKQPEEDGCVCKAPKKEDGFDLECMKENFMEAKKRFAEASTTGSHNRVPKTNVTTEADPSVLTMFLETCMKLFPDNKAMKGI